MHPPPAAQWITALNLRARVYTSAPTLPSAAGDLFLGTFRSAGPGDMGGFGDREMVVTPEMTPRAVEEAGAGRGSKGLIVTLCTLGPPEQCTKGANNRNGFWGRFLSRAPLAKPGGKGWGGTEKGP